MMYAIEKGNVPTYHGNCDELVYLVTTVEQVVRLGLPVVFTDRNAVLGVATFSSDPARLDSMIDWPLMKATYWSNTEAEPDRRERRMAECLVFERVPWAAFHGIVTRNQACANQAGKALSAVGASAGIAVRPAWYF
jgi:hypothetical protein